MSKIPLFKINWKEKDIRMIENVLKSGKHWCVGSQIEKFEEKIKKTLNGKYCLVFNSGGSALHSLMHAHGFGRNDEIIVPSFTFIATAYAPLYVGAKPVFADIEEETFGLDPKDVIRKISAKTKAIMPIHYGGNPCRINELKEIADNNNLVLIEDAAESFGAEINGKKIGTIGDSSIFSFCQNKIFTTSEGGCLLTRSEEIYHSSKLFRSYGRSCNGNYFDTPGSLDYVKVGFNYRLSTLLAALGLSQLERADKMIAQRRKNAKYLNQNLKEIKGIVVPERPRRKYFSVYQMYTLRILKGEKLRNKLREYLSSKGIESKVYFSPVHNYSVFRKNQTKHLDLTMTEKISKEVLTLPMYPDLTINDLDYMIDSIRSFFR